MHHISSIKTTNQPKTNQKNPSTLKAAMSFAPLLFIQDWSFQGDTIFVRKKNFYELLPLFQHGVNSYFYGYKWITLFQLRCPFLNILKWLLSNHF